MMLQRTNSKLIHSAVEWEAATTGNYTTLSGVSTVNLWSPTGAGDRAYNHHPHIKVFNGRVYAMYSTANTDEEEPGQYARYQYSDDDGVTWSDPITLVESQDDITKGWTSAGRVCIPASWAIADGFVYGVVDVNDKGASDSSRTGVGVLAIRVNDSGSVNTPRWIENVDGTTNAPTAVSGYPSYTFDSTLRTKIRAYLSIIKYKPAWYYSVLSTDPLYSRETFGANECSEPSAELLPNGQEIILWRELDGAADLKIGQLSRDGGTFVDTFETKIPDQPSKTKIMRYSGGVCVIGNNDNATRNPLFIGFSKSGVLYKDSNVYDLDTGSGTPTYSGQYKTQGYQYPDSDVLDTGDIITLYSQNKEDIKIAYFTPPIIN